MAMIVPLTVASAPAADRDGPDGSSLDTRLERIRKAVAPNWRPDEWDPDTQVLRPAIDDPYLRTRPPCRVAGCWTDGLVRTGLCQGCTSRFEASGNDDLDAWVASTDAGTRRRRLSGACCRVSRHDRRCPRPAEGSVDLCVVHHERWQTARRSGVNFDEFLARSQPLSELGRCRAVACHLPAARVGTRLCTLHQAIWRRAGRPEGGALEEWARTVRGPAGPVLVLRGLPELVEAELLYAIQQREREQIRTDLAHIATFVRWLRHHAVASLADVDPDDFDSRGGVAHTRFARFAVDRVTLAEATIEDERVKDHWDLRVFGKQRRSRVDFTVIPIGWLRAAAKAWVEASAPRISEESLAEGVILLGLFGTTLRTRPDRGEHPEALSRHDIDRFLAAVPQFRSTRTGRTYSPGERDRIVSRTGTVLREAREFGFLDQVPATCSIRRGEFTTTRRHSEITGKALPAVVIAQLDAHLDELRRVPGKNMITREGARALGPLGEHVGALAVLAYQLLRSTGRRCGEIATLHVDCLRHDCDDRFMLVYDNHKAGRPGRRLPLEDSELIEIIRAHQQLIRDAFPGVADAELYMFPRVNKNRDGSHHIPSQSLAKWLRSWVDGLAELHNGIPAAGGGFEPFDRTAVHPHAFRHTYAQLLADNGVSPHTLRELMDHLSMETTLGYYNVGERRKRDAMHVMARHTADHHGHIPNRPALSDVGCVSEELHWVAIPFGKCSEPTNIRAGGHACPIRWQCPACPHFQSDPSYLPELRAHVDTLRRQREAAITIGADAWVIDNLTHEVNAVQHHVDIQQQRLQELPDDERVAVEQASRDLRKTRLLLPVTTARPDHAQ